jgi:hypothetical protein
MAGRVRIEIGGQVFTIPRESLEKGPTSRLQKMYRSAFASYKTRVIVEERPHEMFAAILAMYQTGELHIPLTSCPGAFMNELHFWEIPVELLSPCCYNRLDRFIKSLFYTFGYSQYDIDVLLSTNHNTLKNCRPNRIPLANQTIG